MNIVGQQLVSPEAGWKRIDDTNYCIIYNGIWLNTINDSHYFNSSTHYSNDNTANIEFYFYGTKLRLMCAYSNNRSKNISVTIDNTRYDNLTQYIDGQQLQTCFFEANELPKMIHHVIIKNLTTDFLDLDSLDIDSDSYMIYLNPIDNKLYFDVTPIMTSDNYNGYITSASTKYSDPNYWNAYRAFTGNDSNNQSIGWCSLNGSSKNQWLQIDLKTGIESDSFIIGNMYNNVNDSSSNNSSNSAPKSFIIQGSNDGTNFDNIYISDANLTWGNNDKKFCHANCTKKYRYYRLFIDSNVLGNESYNYICIKLFRILLSVDAVFYLLNDNGIIKKYDDENNKLVNVDNYNIINNVAIENECIYDLNKIFPLIEDFSKIKILSNKEIKLELEAIKSKEEFFISSTLSTVKIAEVINSIDIIENKSEGVIIKTAIADKNDNYFVWDNENFVWNKLTNTCVNKDVPDMTSDELNNYYLLKREVKEKGMTTDILKICNLASLSDYIRFAHYILINKASDNGVIKQIEWTYDRSSGYTKLSTMDAQINTISSKFLEIIPNRDIPEAKIEVVKTFKNTSGESTKIQINDEEMKNKITSGWEV